MRGLCPDTMIPAFWKTGRSAAAIRDLDKDPAVDRAISALSVKTRK